MSPRVTGLTRKRLVSVSPHAGETLRPELNGMSPRNGGDCANSTRAEDSRQNWKDGEMPAKKPTELNGMSPRNGGDCANSTRSEEVRQYWRDGKKPTKKPTEDSEPDSDTVEPLLRPNANANSETAPCYICLKTGHMLMDCPDIKRPKLVLPAVPPDAYPMTAEALAEARQSPPLSTCTMGEQGTSYKNGLDRIHRVIANFKAL